jgi:hypothetical protein
MNLQVALGRLDSLTSAELSHARSLALIEVENYTRAIRNYPPERMKKFGEPHLKRLHTDLAKIDAAIKSYPLSPKECCHEGRRFRAESGEPASSHPGPCSS